MLIHNIGCAVDISYTYQAEKVRVLVIINWICYKEEEIFFPPHLPV